MHEGKRCDGKKYAGVTLSLAEKSLFTVAFNLSVWYEKWGGHSWPQACFFTLSALILSVHSVQKDFRCPLVVEKTKSYVHQHTHF